MARQGSSHLVGGNLIEITGNAAGTTWSGVTTVIDTAKDIRDVEVTTLSDGTEICSYTEHTEGVEDYVPKVIIRPLGGSWGSSITVTHGFTKYGFVTSKVVEGNDVNTLYLAVYGVDTGGASGVDDYCKVVRSTDKGATWAVLSTVVAHGYGGREWTEPTMCRRANGTYVVAMRSDTGGSGIHVVTSSDCVTWTAPFWVFAGSGRPSIHETPEAALVIAYRQNAVSGSPPGARWCVGPLDAWSAPHDFGVSTPYVYGSWVDRLDGDLGLLWSIEEFADNDTDADLHVETFEYVP